MWRVKPLCCFLICAFCAFLWLTSWIAQRAQVGSDLVDDGGVFDRRWNSILNTVSHLLDRSSHDLTRTSFWKPVHNCGHFERRHWSNLLPHELDQFRDDLFVRSIDSQLEHD